MAQDYTVKLWEPWVDRETDELVQDDFGNFKGTVHFEEDTRGVDATFKKQPEPGEVKYGDIVGYKTKAGKARQKFQRAERQEGGNHVSNQSNPSGPKSNYVPRDDNAIRAQWAIGQVVGVLGLKDMYVLEQEAAKLYAMVDRVKGSSESTDPKEVSQPSSNPGKSQDSIATQSTPTTSGSDDYDATDAEWKNLSKSLDQGVPIEM